MLIVAPCSAQKRFPVPPELDGSSIRARSVTAYARQWTRRIGNAAAVAPASEVYSGAGLIAARRAAAVCSGRLLFVSAGLGTVWSDQSIPSYNLTVSYSGPGPFSTTPSPHLPAQWWAALNQHCHDGAPLAAQLPRQRGAIVVALPRSYLSMVHDDLCQLPPATLARTRIITTSDVELDPRLRTQAIHYDARLNGLGGEFSGAMASLVQRGALHFVGQVLGDGRLKSIEAERRRVFALLQALPAPNFPKRKKMTDAGITDMIFERSPPLSFTASGALRALRERGIACEQSRFERLFVEVQRGCA
jgi:hypothetical protein